MESKTDIVENELRISTSQGTIQGTTYTSEFNQQQYCAFLGIPYAKPPINELRFMPPVPPKKWNGVLDARKEGNSCIHFSIYTRTIIGSEDCLYLNIYTPLPPCKITSPKAVIVEIHGGGNNWGSGSSNNFGAPDYIVHHDVIFVTFNYRLHSLGFMNLNLPNCAGNMGLKDQVMALRWIKENIKYFGGDPDNVTLYGCSSGASNVHFHMMSPLSKGLFHKVILQSGYALSQLWAIRNDTLERAFEYGHILGFQGNNPKRLLRYLKNKSAMDLALMGAPLRTCLKQRSGAIPDVTPFRPSVEIFEENAFMACHPRKLMEKVVPLPMLVDLCEEEGSNMFLIDVFAAMSKGLPYVIEKNLFMHKLTPETLQYVADKVQSFYFGEETDYKKVFKQVLKFFMDMWTCEWQSMVDFQAKMAPVYIYHFLFLGDFNYQNNFFIRPLCSADIVDEIGSCHADESSYFTHYKMINEIKKISASFNPKETKVINNMATINTNFAKTGNPNGNLSENVKWRSHTPEDPCYLKFDLDLEVVNGVINEDRAIFWKDLMNYIKEHEPLEE